MTGIRPVAVRQPRVRRQQPRVRRQRGGRRRSRPHPVLAVWLPFVNLAGSAELWIKRSTNPDFV